MVAMPTQLELVTTGSNQVQLFLPQGQSLLQEKLESELERSLLMSLALHELSQLTAFLDLELQPYQELQHVLLLKLESQLPQKQLVRPWPLRLSRVLNLGLQHHCEPFLPLLSLEKVFVAGLFPQNP